MKFPESICDINLTQIKKEYLYNRYKYIQTSLENITTYSFMFSSYCKEVENYRTDKKKGMG